MSKISVIVPLYNMEAYLERCVDSILSQTFTDFDVILVDDGSTDRSAEICDAYAEKEQRVFVLHQENKGLSGARNAGLDWALSKSGSEWICFVDSDDWVTPDYLWQLYDAVTVFGEKISCCKCDKPTADDGSILEKKRKVNKICLTFETFFCGDYPEIDTVAWGKLYKKELFQTIRFPVGKIMEDVFVTHQILYNAQNIVMVDAELYHYFQRDTSIIHQNYTLARLDEIEGLEQQYLFLQEKQEYKAAEKTLKVLFNGYVSHIKNLQQINEKAEAKRLKKTLKRLLKKEGARCEITVSSWPWVYEVLYPTVMSVYWIVMSVRKKIKKGIGI